MKWIARIELADGTCSEHELPKGRAATWRVGASRRCDVRLPQLGAGHEVTLDLKNARWFASAPGARTLDGATGLVGKEMRHGDGFQLEGVRLAMLIRTQRDEPWDERERFGELREALHARDWRGVLGLLYRWPRAGGTSYRRAESYALDLLAREEVEEFGEIEQLEGDGLRELWRSLKARR